jgi:hypothetical protein
MSGRGNRSTRRKYASVPLRPPQTPYDLARNRTLAAAVGSRRLTQYSTSFSLQIISGSGDMLQVLVFVTPCKLNA